MPGRIVRRGAALGLGVLWWWAVLRLALAPGAGMAEAGVAAGGWGLSVLPVHCVPKGRAVGAVGRGRWRRALRSAADPAAGSAARSGAGSGAPPGAGSGAPPEAGAGSSG
ncbi:hypothetical protein AB0L35_32985 [Streptomyces sp. NPDC052309]|uniref:hypothetical protein n=1 Tax=Streptomyces sp. NPDC052309 TaxID=3155421 RepID=UPI00344216D9